MPLLLALALSGCTLLQGGTPLVLEGDGFFDHPWPDDRRRVNGQPELSDFPQADSQELIGKYLAMGEQLDGFGTNSPIYLRFAREPDLGALPDPARSTHPAAPVLIVNVDPDSPFRGERAPYQFTWMPDATDWLPGELLALQPVWGAPLRPRTTYAVVLRSGFAQPVDDFRGVLWDAHPDAPTYASTAATLTELGVPVDDVAYAFQFTTQDTVGEMAAIARVLHEELPTEPLDQPLRLYAEANGYTAWVGTVVLPIWTHGVPPYYTEGGQFELDADGEPILAGWEEADFIFSVPTGDDMPEAGWPVVLTAHGTGGDAGSHFYASDPLQIAATLARGGMAAFGVALPFHGDRGNGGDPSLVSFNLLNPSSGRTAFRQGALEQVYLAHLLASTPHAFRSAEGQSPRMRAQTDPDRVAYLGHSHGGEIGILAAPYFRDDVRGVVLSGAGAGLSISIVERDAGDFDIQGLLRSALALQPDEALTVVHPAIGLVQMVAEVTDPMNYGPYWHRWEPDWPATPQNVLQFEGLTDIYTPPRAIEVLAGAAGQPIFAPVLQQDLVQTLQNLDGVGTPAAQNLRAWDGSPLTGGLAQYPEDGHFAVFDNPDAAALYQGFLSTALGDGPAEVPLRP